MPLLDHLDELRRRIIIIVLTLFIASSVLYIWSWEFFDFIMKPVIPHLNGGELNVFGPFEAFTFRFKVALYAALVLTSPVWLWQILAFFLPALKPKEQRYFIPTFLVGVALFVLGNAFCYLVVLGPAFGWLMGQVGGAVGVIPDAARFMSGVTLLMMGFGIAFELPVVIFYLVAFGVVPYGKLRENWRTAYVVLMVIASVATPDWSPVTMGLLFGSLLALYEASLAFARLVFAKRIAAEKRALEEA